MKIKAVILLSGGLDSTVAGYICKEQGMELYALTFNYGQRHVKEIEAAKTIAKLLNVKEHKILDISFLKDITINSSLTNPEIKMEENRTPEEMTNIPSMFVPGRNLIFLSIACSYAINVGATVICFGSNQLDFSGYPDCRTSFFRAMDNVMYEATREPVVVFTPLQFRTKVEIIKEGLRLNAPLSLTWSCYKGGDKPCGVCDACILRKKAFEEINAESVEK